ncbi:dihydroneopterin triphosphate diphosphatase [Granulosicoccus sp. 3-233]|uniref:dihydroneopterin triphosphate diphosphatase n=1 Tax=Granulosicoccus sp. 3-233 TaxID=3417969 RepID=UPI003D334C8E
MPDRPTGSDRGSDDSRPSVQGKDGVGKGRADNVLAIARDGDSARNPREAATGSLPGGKEAVSSLFKRPESVLVVVYTTDLEVLLIRRQNPADFWQSVTGSLEPGETPAEAAVRELAEETGIVAVVNDHATSRSFPIAAAWRRRYAPGVTENLEHEFSVQLPARCQVVLDPNEHGDYCWLPLVEAIARVSSRTNRAALQAILKAEG